MRSIRRAQNSPPAGRRLLLFRDQYGRVGLTEPSCPHRGTSLEYGWIEAGGIRCCYHGWVFDVNGRCIEQPGEPAEVISRIRSCSKPIPPEKRRHNLGLYGARRTAAVSALRLLSARMASELTWLVRECNFLNQLDNCLDPVHATILHGREVNGARENPERAETPSSKCSPTIYSLVMLRAAKGRSRQGVASRSFVHAADTGHP